MDTHTIRHSFLPFLSTSRAQIGIRVQLFYLAARYLALSAEMYVHYFNLLLHP